MDSIKVKVNKKIYEINAQDFIKLLKVGKKDNSNVIDVDKVVAFLEANHIDNAPPERGMGTTNT